MTDRLHQILRAEADDLAVPPAPAAMRSSTASGSVVITS